MPGCLESSESESSKTEEEASAEKIGEKASAAKEGKETEQTSKIQDGGDHQDRGSKKSRRASKKASTPFGETDKRDADGFYVDIIYAVLHMIGKLFMLLAVMISIFKAWLGRGRPRGRGGPVILCFFVGFRLRPLGYCTSQPSCFYLVKCSNLIMKCSWEDAKKLTWFSKKSPQIILCQIK